MDTFIEFSRGYGLELSRSQAQSMKDAWFDSFPEVRNYLSGEQGHVYTLTGRRRAGTTFCAEKNTPFQGLAADGLKLALYAIDRKYKIVNEVHDQILVECPAEGSEEVLRDVSAIMVAEMRKVVPDVRVATEGVIVTRWTK